MNQSIAFYYLQYYFTFFLDILKNQPPRLKGNNQTSDYIFLFQDILLVIETSIKYIGGNKFTREANFNLYQNKNKVFKLRLILFCFVSFTVSAQDYSSFSYSIKDYNQSYINSDMLIDDDGFSWYATEKGLMKDIGGSRQFIPLSFSSNHKIPIHSIIKDNKKFIWIACKNGLYKVNTTTFTHEFLDLDLFTPNEHKLNYKLLKGENNDIVLMGPNGFHYLFKNGELKKYIINSTPKIISKTIHAKPKDVLIVNNTSVFLLRKQKIYLIFKGPIKNGFYHEAYIMDSLPLPKNSHIQYYKYKKNLKPYIYLDNIKKYYIEFPGKTIFMPHDKNREYQYIFENVKESNLIFSDFKKLENGYFLKGNWVIPLEIRVRNLKYIPKTNTIWIANWASIRKIRLRKNYFKAILKKNIERISTRAIIKNENQLLIGSYTGLYKYDLSLKKNKQYRDFSPLFSINLVDDNIAWCASGFRHLEKYHLEKGLLKAIPIPYTSLFLKKKENNLYWLGTYNGLYEFNSETEKIEPFELSKELNNLSEHIIYAIVEDQEFIWIATDIGLYKWNRKLKTSLYFSTNSMESPIINNIVKAIHLDKNRNLWVGTHGGINKISPDNYISYYSTTEGISDNKICSILETDGNLWFGTFNGITRYNIKTEKISKLFVSDKLNDNEYNYRSSFKLNDSILYFGGTNGVYEINTKKISKEFNSPELVPISLETQMIENDMERTSSKVASLDKIDLKYSRNHFLFSFALTNSFNHKNNKYLYKIEGLMKDWANLQEQNLIRVYGIPPGKYTLRVKGINDEGIKAKNELMIPLTIHQVFYKSTWFIVLGTTLATLLMFLLFRWYFLQKKEKERASYKIKELELSALTSQMTPHFIFNTINGIQNVMMLKGELATNQYISTFSKLLRTTMNISKTYTISISEEMAYLDAYIKLQENRIYGGFQYSITYNKELDFSKYFIPGLLFQSLVENAIIHGLQHKPDNRILKLIFKVKDNMLTVTISDNGIGKKASEKLQVKKEKYNYRATQILERRIALSNYFGYKNISIKTMELFPNNPYPGTLIIMKIPFKKRIQSLID